VDEAERSWSEESFWAKLARYARVAGRQVVETALVLFHCLRDPDTPAWARAVILGALAWFVAPVDAIPDLTPLVGYTDDLGARVALAVQVRPLPPLLVGHAGGEDCTASMTCLAKSSWPL